MLSVEELDLLDNCLADFPFSCGSPIVPRVSELHDKVAVITNITCSSPQHPLNYDEMFAPTCSTCGDLPNNEEPLFYNEKVRLEGRFGTVLPICVHCKAEGTPNPTLKAKQKGTKGQNKRLAAAAATAGSGKGKKKVRKTLPGDKARNPSLTQRAQGAKPVQSHRPQRPAPPTCVSGPKRAEEVNGSSDDDDADNNEGGSDDEGSVNEDCDNEGGDQGGALGGGVATVTSKFPWSVLVGRNSAARSNPWCTGPDIRRTSARTVESNSNWIPLISFS
jgi:hypothetical protein